MLKLIIIIIAFVVVVVGLTWLIVKYFM